MKKGWTITKLITSGSIGVLMTLIAMPGSLFATSIGIPGAGAVLNAFILPFFIIFSLLLVNKFGTSIIVGTMYGLLLLPMPITGPPGLLPKVFLWMLAGFTGDLLWVIFKKYEKLRVIFTAGLMSIIVLFLFVEFLLLFQIPGGDKFAGLVVKPIVPIGIFLWGTLGGITGWFAYQKLKNTIIVKRIQR